MGDQKALETLVDGRFALVQYRTLSRIPFFKSTRQSIYRLLQVYEHLPCAFEIQSRASTIFKVHFLSTSACSPKIVRLSSPN